jgi:hypothetical protein
MGKSDTCAFYSQDNRIQKNRGISLEQETEACTDGPEKEANP